MKRLVVFCALVFMVLGWFSPSGLYGQTYNEGFWLNEARPSLDKIVDPTGPVTFAVALPFRDALAAQTNHAEFSFYLKAYMAEASLVEAGRSFDLELLAKVYLEPTDATLPLELVPSPVSGGGDYWKLPLTHTSREAILWSDLNTKIKQRITSGHAYSYKAIQIRIQGVCKTGEPTNPNFNIQSIAGVSGDPRAKYVNNWVKLVAGYKAKIDFSVEGVQVGPSTPVYNPVDREIRGQKSVSFAWTISGNPAHVGVPAYKLQIVKLENDKKDNSWNIIPFLANYYAAEQWIEKCTTATAPVPCTISTLVIEDAKYKGLLAQLDADYRNGKLIKPRTPDWDNALELLVVNSTQAQVFLPYGTGFYTWRVVPLGVSDGKLSMGSTPTQWYNYMSPPSHQNPKYVTIPYDEMGIYVNGANNPYLTFGGSYVFERGNPFLYWLHLNDRAGISSPMLRKEPANHSGALSNPPALAYTRTWEGSPLFFFHDPDSARNRVYQRVVLEDNNVKEVEQFANGLDQLTQTQTALSSDGKVVIVEKKYDFGGREVVETLPAVQDQPEGLAGYKKRQTMPYDPAQPNFYRPYNAFDFDNEDRIRAPRRINDKRNGYDFYGSGPVGSAQYYPFRRTIFDLFDDKRLAEKSGFGAEFRIHPPLTEGASVHTSRYLYGKPTQDEIDRLFGEGVAPLASQTTKEIDVDANGTKTIKYLNMEGKVIATAIGFSDNKKLEESLDGEELPTPTALLGRGEYDGAVRRARTNLIVAPENLSGSSFGVVLDYTLEPPPSLQDKFCNIQPFSAEYETYIRITRTDGSIWTSLNLPPSIDGGTTSQFEIESDARIITLKMDQKLRFLFKVGSNGVVSIEPVNFSGTSPYPFAKAFLGVGSYEIEKVLVCKTSPNIVVSASEEASHRQTEPLVNLLKEWMSLQGSNSCNYSYKAFTEKVQGLITDINSASTGGMTLAALDSKYKMLCRYTPTDPTCAALLSSYQYCNCMNEAERSGGGTTLSTSCDDTQLQSQFTSCFPDKFFTAGHSVQFLPAGATLAGPIMPIELLITTPCCQLVMPILMDDKDQCVKKVIPQSNTSTAFSELDRNSNGVLEVNPFYGNKDLREMLPDFEGYAYNYFWSCADLTQLKALYTISSDAHKADFTRKVSATRICSLSVNLIDEGTKRRFLRAMNDLEYVRLSSLASTDPNLEADMADNALRLFHIYEKYLRPNMGGYEKAGTFNLMVNKMLTDQLSCDGRQAVLKPASSGGLNEEMVSLRDWPAERAACEDDPEKLVKAENSFWLMKATSKEEFKYNWDNTYNCQDLFRCWTVQLNNIKQSAGSEACKQTPDGGNVFPSSESNEPTTSYNNNNNNTPSQNFDGESGGTTVHDNHLKDNIKLGALASLFGAKRKIRRLINRIGNQVRNSQQPQQSSNPPGPCSGPAGDDVDGVDPASGCNTATCDDNVPDDNTEDDACSTCSTCTDEGEVETVETRYTYHLVEEFLNCAGRRFQRILFDVNDPAQVFRVDTENGVAKSYTSDPVGGQQKYPLDVDKRTSGVDYDIPQYVYRVDERTSKKQARRSMAYGRYLIDMAWAASAHATPAGGSAQIASYIDLLQDLKVFKKDAGGNYVSVSAGDINSTSNEYYVNGKRFRLWDEGHFVYLTLDLQPIDGPPVVPAKGEIRLITERYSGVNDLYVPSWVWNGLPDAGGEKDPFAFIFDPVYAYKYFTYYPDMFSSLEVETCFRDPNALHTTNASNQEVVTPYIEAGGAGVQTLSKHPYDPTTGAVSTSSTDVPLVPYCELGYKYCLSTRRDWSCGQRESFYAAIANYREPSNDEIDGLTQCLFVTPDDFTSIGTVIPVVSPYNESNATPDYTHLRFYPWDIERTQLDVAAPTGNPAIDPNAEIYTKISYTFPGSIRKLATVPRYRNDRYSYLELASTGYRPTFMAYSANKTPALRKFISDLPLRSLVEIQLNQMNRRVAQTCHEQYNSIRVQIERTLLENGYSVGNCVTNCDKTVTPDDISEMAWSMVDECLARGIVTTYRTTQTRCRSSYARSTTAGYVDRQDHIMAAIPGVEYGVVDESNLHRPVTSTSNLPCDDAAAGCPAGFPSSLQSKVLTARRFWPCAACATTNTMALPVDAMVKDGSTYQPVSKYFWKSTGGATSTVMNSIFQSVGSMGNTPASFASGSAGPSGTSANFNVQLDDYFQNMQEQFPYVEVSAGAERNYITTTVPNPRDLNAAPQKYFVYEVKPSAPSSQITYLGLTRHREVTNSPTVVYGLRLDDVWLPNASAPVAPPYATSGNPLEECANPPTATNQFFSPTLQPGSQSPLLSVDQDISMSFLPGTHGQNTSGVAEGGKPPREFLFYRVQINDLDDHSAPQAREVIHTESQHLIEQP
ncbi:hypothetical protein WDZ92_01270 [Nostoc sp. NIES-2111]